jgi:hypothetical protein
MPRRRRKLESQESRQGGKAETQYGGGAADAKSFLTALASVHMAVHHGQDDPTHPVDGQPYPCTGRPVHELALPVGE